MGVENLKFHIDMHYMAMQYARATRLLKKEKHPKQPSSSAAWS
jgi:hypothetical protein